MVAKMHPATAHIRDVLGNVEPPCQKAVIKHLNRCGQAIPDTEIGALLNTGSPSQWLRRKIEADYRDLYFKVMMPYLSKAYRRAGNHPTRRRPRNPPEAPRFWSARGERFVQYMRREQEAAFRAMARASRMGTVAQGFGAEFFKACYGLLAQDAIRSMNWAATRAQLKKADPDAIERMLAQREVFVGSQFIDAEEIRRRKFESIKAVKKLKQDRARMIAAAESTAAFQAGRWASEEQLQEERAELEQMLAAERTRARESNVYIREEVHVPAEYRETLAALERDRERQRLQQEDRERAAAQRALEEELNREPEVTGMARWEVWVTMLPQDVHNVCEVCKPMLFEERQVQDLNNPENWPGNTVPVMAPREEMVHLLCKCTTFYRSYINWSDGTRTHFDLFDEYRTTYPQPVMGTDIEDFIERPVEAGGDADDWAEADGVRRRRRRGG